MFRKYIKKKKPEKNTFHPWDKSFLHIYRNKSIIIRGQVFTRERIDPIHYDFVHRSTYTNETSMNNQNINAQIVSWSFVKTLKKRNSLIFKSNTQRRRKEKWSKKGNQKNYRSWRSKQFVHTVTSNNRNFYTNF